MLNVKTKNSEYSFDGPHASVDNLESKSGAYVVTTKANDGKHNVIDVGESAKVKDRVSNHDRTTCWTQNKKDGLFYSGYYCSETTRMSVADEIRDHYNPPCGEK